MYKKITNQLVLTKDAQGNDLAKVLGETILTLLKENQAISITADDFNIIVLEYEHDNRYDDWGGPSCLWLEEDEVENLYDYRAQKEENEKGQQEDEDDDIGRGNYS